MGNIGEKGREMEGTLRKLNMCLIQVPNEEIKEATNNILSDSGKNIPELRSRSMVRFDYK